MSTDQPIAPQVDADPFDMLRTRMEACMDKLPDLPHTREFLDHMKRAYAAVQKNPTPKAIILEARKLYPDLSLMEAWAAMGRFSSGAHIASGATDPRTYGLFQEVFFRHKEREGGNIPMPRLVVLHSDVPGAYASASCNGQQSVFVTTGAIDMLGDAELRATMGHELGHIKRDLNKPLWITTPIDAVRHPLTRNATRRKMEFAADRHSVDIGNDPEALISAQRKMHDFMRNCIAPVKTTLDEVSAELRHRNDPVSKALDWVIEKKARRPLGDMLTRHSRTTTRRERICKAPSYPTLIERADALRGHPPGDTAGRTP